MKYTKLTPAQYRRLAAGLDREIKRLQLARTQLGRIDEETYRAGRDLFSADSALALWLCEPAPALGGRVPITVMRTASGRTKVANVLKTIAHGVPL